MKNEIKAMITNISDKTDFKTKAIVREKEGQYITIKDQPNKRV